MPTFMRGDVSCYDEELCSGRTSLWFAPGAMRSIIDFWYRSPFGPAREFASDFRVIAEVEFGIPPVY